MKLNTRTLAWMIVALTSCGVVAAQAGGDTAGEMKKSPPAMDSEKPQILTTLTGLEASKVARVEAALRAITFENEKGEKVPAIRKVAIDVEKKQAAITVTPGSSLRLTTIEKAIAPTGVKIDREGLSVQSGCVLEVKGKGDDSSLRETIDDADLFENFQVKPSPKALTYEVNVVKSSEKTTHSRVTKALSRGEYELADVTWSNPKKEKMPEKAKAGGARG